MRCAKGRNPVGVGGIFSPIPKVAFADSGNLGLEDGTPFGFFPSPLSSNITQVVGWQ